MTSRPSYEGVSKRMGLLGLVAGVVGVSGIGATALAYFRSRDTPPIPKMSFNNPVMDVARPPLPVEQVRSQAPAYVAPVGREPLVLIVDDDPDVGEIIGIMLNQLGCEVTSEITATDALEKLAAGYLPDLIISDVRMPEKNGFEFASDVADLYPAIPVILMTGYFNELESKPLRWRMLHKPISQHDLAGILNVAR